jgi:hypothetical protein
VIGSTQLRRLWPHLLLVASLLAVTQPHAQAQSSIVEETAANSFTQVLTDRCEVRGAVWAGGSRAGVEVDLIEANGTAHRVVTDSAGAYRLRLRYVNPLVLTERIANRSTVLAKYRDSAHIVNSTVMCDPVVTELFRLHPQLKDTNQP